MLLIPASVRGRDYGPRLAGELELGMTGDCVNLDIAKAGRLLQTKPAYGGNIVSDDHEPHESPAGDRSPADVRATGAARRRGRGRPGRPRPAAARAPHLVERGDELDAWRLDEAEIVVLSARTEGRRGAAPIAREAGAAVGATREVCEPGAPWSHHVGLYGRPVAPRVLIAVGVPGGFEHLSGFVKADVVVALPEAAWPADVQVRQSGEALPCSFNASQNSSSRYGSPP